MAKPNLHDLSFRARLLDRGFWLYIWKIDLTKGRVVHYVGRTGDSSSLNAQSPFARVSAHLGSNENSNTLRKQLCNKGYKIRECEYFELVAYGPIYPETKSKPKFARSLRRTAALERELCSAMKAAGYRVLNDVRSNAETDEGEWLPIRAAFAEQFPDLRR